MINPVSELITHNPEACTFTHADNEMVQFFDSRRDHIKFGEGPYKALGFQPSFVEHLTGFKFVYLNPHNVGERRREDNPA